MRLFAVTALIITLNSNVALARDLSTEERQVIKSLAISGLRDPDSALIRWPDYSGGPYYCGLINAKNAYGGYVGYRLFIVFVEDQTNLSSVQRVMVDGIASSSDSAFARSVCGSYNYPLG